MCVKRGTWNTLSVCLVFEKTGIHTIGPDPDDGCVVYKILRDNKVTHWHVLPTLE